MAAQRAVEKAIYIWQPYYSEPLTARDGEEILANWSAYVSLIAEWTTNREEPGT